MKRRLDLASALVHSPGVLFLDEPTTGLDPASRLTIWEEVRRINAGGATVFLTTQYLEEADQLCDRVAIIDDGQIVAQGTPEQLKAEMGHDVVSVSVEGANVAATEAALSGLPGLERVVLEPDGLALYVEDGAGSIAEIVRRLEREQIRAGAISVASPSLDDVFLKATGRRLEGQERPQHTPETSKVSTNDRSPSTGPPRHPRDRPLSRGHDPDAVHPAVLPRGQHRAGIEDVPEHHPVPQRPGVRRLPAPGVVDVRGRDRHLGSRARDRDRPGLLRQAAGRADPALVDHLRPPDRRPRPRDRSLSLDPARQGSRSALEIAGRRRPARS